MTLASWTLLGGLGADAVPDDPPYGNGRYAEVYNDEEATEGINDDNSWAKKVYRVDWGQRAQFMDDLLGSSVVTGFVLQRTLPNPHPEYKSFYAVEAEVKHVGPPSIDLTTNNVAFPYAEITATYRPLPYAVLADNSNIPNENYRFVSVERTFQSEYLTLQGQMQFVTRKLDMLPNPALDVAPGMVVGQQERIMTWHMVPAKTYLYLDQTGVPHTVTDFAHIPNEFIITDLLGKVNQSTFAGTWDETTAKWDLDSGYRAGTVLFTGCEARLVRPKLKTGAYYWDLTFKFLVKDNGTWATNSKIEVGPNFIFDVTYRRWDLITADGTYTANNDTDTGTGTDVQYPSGTVIYEADELNALFIWS